MLLQIFFISLLTLTSGQKTIQFAFFHAPESRELGTSDLGSEAVVRYGIEKVREKSGVLDGYTLNFTSYNSGCSQTQGNRAYINMLQTDQQKKNIFILGPACSPAANPIARDAGSTNIHVVSYSATSAELSNNETFQNFYRVAASDLVLVQGRVNFVKSQGWSRVGIISQLDSLFSSTASAISSQLTESGISTELFLYLEPGSIPDLVKSIIEESYSVLIGNFYSRDAVRFLCEFYKRGRLSPTVTWIMIGWYPRNYWNTSTTNCTPDELRRTLDYAVSFDSFPTSNEPEAPTFLGPSTNEFRSTFNATMRLEKQIFDSFGAIVYSLDSYEKNNRELCAQDSSFCLENFTYDSVGISKLLNQELLRTDFQGVGGRVQFDHLGDRIANVTVSQWFNGVPNVIGISYGNQIMSMNEGVQWPGDQLPSDGIEYIQDSIDIPQFVVTSLLALLAAGMSVVYCVITLIYWKRKVIQAYHPTLTVAMLLGTLLLYAFIILNGLQNLRVGQINQFLLGETGYNIICNLDLWLGFTGFALTYVPIFLRTLEALYIVEYRTKYPMARKKFLLKRVYLLALLAAYLAGILMYLLMWTASSSTRLRLSVQTQSATINQIPTMISTPYCGSDSIIGRQIVSGVLVAVNCVFLILGMVFVIITKDLKYKGLSDSVYIGISVYSLVIFGAMAYGASVILQLNIDIRYGITSTSLIIGLVIVSNLMVIPKLVLVVRDRKDEQDYGTVSLLKNSLNDSDFAVQLKKRVDTLEAENTDLRERICSSDTAERKVQQNWKGKLLGSIKKSKHGEKPLDDVEEINMGASNPARNENESN